MGTSLTGKNISSTYLGLLKTTDNAVIGSTAKRLTDGNGTDSPLYLSTSKLGIGVTPTEALTISSGNIQLSNDNKIQFGTSDVYIKGTTATDNIQLGLQGATKLTLHQTTGLTLAQYGGGTITGTVTQRLGVTSAGQVVEIPIGGGAVDGSGTAGKITKWTDSDTIGDSILSESGSVLSNTGIFRTSGGSAGTPAYAFTDATNTGMFIDGGNLKLSNAGDVGLYIDGNGNTIIDNKLGVGATSLTRGLTVSGAGALGTILASDGTVNTVLWGDASGSNHGGVGTDNNYGFNIYQNGGVAIEIDTSKNTTFAGSITGTSASLTTSGTVLSLDRTGGATALIELKVSGTVEGYLGATTTKSLVVFNESASEKFSISNTGDGTFAGDVSIAEKLIHSGDTNTYLQFSSTNDKIVFATNGSDALTLDASNNATFAGTVAINSFLTINGVSAGTSTFQQWKNDGTLFAYNGSAAAIISGGSATDYVAGNTTGATSVILATNNAARLTISAGGDAEFKGDMSMVKDVPSFDFVDSNSDSDFRLRNNNGVFEMLDTTNSRTLMSLTSGAVITLDSLGSNTVLNTTGSVVVPNGSVGIGGSPSYELDVNKSEAGGLVDARVYNSESANASSGSRLITAVNGASAGDPRLVLSVAGVQEYHVGIDNSDSDKFVIGTGSTPGTGTLFNMTSSGNATFEGNVAINGLTNSDYDADADNLVLGATSGNTGITIRSGSSVGNYGSIYFADGTGVGAKNAGYISYEQNTSEMSFGINAVKKLGIELDGTATFAGGITVAGNDAQFNHNIVLEGSVFHKDDTNTSFGFPADDTISFSTAGSERMRITSAGLVGIGLTPTTANLEVKSIQDASFDEGIGVVRSNSSQTGYINMVGGAMNINAPNAIPIKFRDGGNTNLTIGGDGNATFAKHIILNNNTGELQSKDAAGTAARILTMDNADTLILGNPTTVDDIRFDVDTYGEGAMMILSSGNVGIGTSSPSAVLDISTGTTNDIIRFGADSRWGFSRANSDSRYVAFMRNQNGSGKAVWTVDGDNGNVGIGTVDPDGKLTISDANATGLEINPIDSENRVNIMAYDRADSAYREINFDGSNYNFEIANSTKLVINSSGNVGIGHTTPQFGLTMGQGSGDGSRIGWEDSSNFKRASILCSSSSDALQFHTGTSDTERMRIQSNGNVGIGTTSPNAKLQVGGDIHIYDEDGNTDGALFFSTGSSDVTSIAVRSNGVSFFNGGNVGIGTSSPDVGGAGSSSTVLSVIETVGNRRGILELGDNQNADTGGIGSINFVGTYQDAGHKIMAEIRASASGSTSGQRGSMISMYTKADASATLTERMRITSAGNVGIGTDTPNTKLDVNGVVVIAPNTDGKQTFEFTTNASNDARLLMKSVDTVKVDIQANDASYFNGGNVGIGTTSPEEKLMVAGAITSTSSNSTGSTSGTNRAIMDLTSGGVRMGHFRGTTAAGKWIFRFIY